MRPRRCRVCRCVLAVGLRDMCEPCRRCCRFMEAAHQRDGYHVRVPVDEDWLKARAARVEEYRGWGGMQEKPKR